MTIQHFASVQCPGDERALVADHRAGSHVALRVSSKSLVSKHMSARFPQTADEHVAMPSDGGFTAEHRMARHTWCKMWVGLCTRLLSGSGRDRHLVRVLLVDFKLDSHEAVLGKVGRHHPRDVFDLCEHKHGLTWKMGTQQHRGQRRTPSRSATMQCRGLTYRTLPSGSINHKVDPLTARREDERSALIGVLFGQRASEMAAQRRSERQCQSERPTRVSHADMALEHWLNSVTG